MSDSAFRYRDSEVDSYLKEIRGVALLSADEERALALRLRKMNSKDEAERRDAYEAREQFVKANLRLVVNLARGFRNRGLPFGDLVAEGNLGLLRAIEGFDPKRKCRFSTYATWWIRQAIRRALANSVRTVRVPIYMAGIVAKYKSAENEASQRLGRKASANDIAAGEEGVSERQQWAIDAADRCWNPVSLDSQRTPCELQDKKEDSAPDFAVGSRMETAALHGLLGAMGKREATILRMRFGLCDGEQKTLSEVGRKLRITRERVRQIEKAALEKLQSRLIVSGEERRRVS
jgi:RNA polymerase primary sigma factor